MAATSASEADVASLMRCWSGKHPYSTLHVFLAEDHDEAAPVPSSGGVCFDLNPAFAHALAAAGVRSTLHVAGVQDHDSPERPDIGSHVAVVSEIDNDSYLTDVGLGCGPIRPIPLRPGDYHFNGFEYRLTTIKRDGQTWWQLRIPAELSRSFEIMEFLASGDAREAVARRAYFLSPVTSPLKDILLIQNWFGAGLATVFGRITSFRAKGTPTSRVEHDRFATWRQTIGTWFPDVFDELELERAWKQLE